MTETEDALRLQWLRQIRRGWRRSRDGSQYRDVAGLGRVTMIGPLAEGGFVLWVDSETESYVTCCGIGLVHVFATIEEALSSAFDLAEDYEQPGAAARRRRLHKRPFVCHDCEMKYDTYNVEDFVWWAATRNDDCHYCFLCLRCLEHRFGRKLTGKDFHDGADRGRRATVEHRSDGWHVLIGCEDIGTREAKVLLGEHNAAIGGHG
jgi:hypothetical protein